MSDTMGVAQGPTLSNFRIEDILSQIATNDAISDIHISSWEHLSFRQNGDVVKYIKVPKLSDEQAENVLKQLMKGNLKAYERFVAEKEADLSYISPDGTPYRVNAFFKLGKVGIVLRKISSEARALNELFFPDIAEWIKENVLWRRQWLFLVTWPTWSGKSTTIVAMLDYLNHQRSDHILTIEDPIEFVFKPNKALISQREIWHDSWSFANALKAAMREDPDIILVWEIRDPDTAEAALNLAETGHLVFSTLHTQSASGTVNRFISFFPPEIQGSIADRLADSLIWVASQRLVKTADGKWRCWVYEIMINTAAVKNNIKRAQIAQIDSILETSAKHGMTTIKQYAARLVTEWKTTKEQVKWILDAK